MDTAPLFAGIGGHHSAKSRTDEWLTPPAIITSLGGSESFDLDPCSPASRPWDTAKRHYTEADNGLILPWAGRVWLNPPYSTALVGRFLGRMADHNRGTALIFARTETEAFFSFVWRRATALLFMEGRINFHHVDGTRAKGNAGAPTVLIAYGQNDAEILSACDIKGQFVPLLLPRFIMVGALCGTWREIVLDYVRSCNRPIKLAELYRALARHPKAAGNRHVDAKIRQVLQRGPFRRVGSGEWEAVDG